MYKVTYKAPIYNPRIAYFRDKTSLCDNFSLTLLNIARELNKDVSIIKARPVYYINKYVDFKLNVEKKKKNGKKTVVL